MNIYNKFKATSIILLATAGLAACGGSSSTSGTTSTGGGTSTTFTGNTADATIDSDNAEDIGTSSGEAVAQSADRPATPFGIVIDDNSDLINLVVETTSVVSAGTYPTGINQDLSASLCTGGGSAIMTIDNINNVSNQTGPVNIDANYINCVISYGGESVTYDGNMDIYYPDFSNYAAFTLTMNNFSITSTYYNSANVTMTLQCTSSTNCTQTSNIVTSSGTHQVSNVSFSGSGSSGYSGSADFFHETHGKVTITVSNLTYGSCDGLPDGGTISFSSGTTSGTINFNSNCTHTGTWNNGSTSGSF